MWISQDRDGSIYRYKDKPKHGKTAWSEFDGFESFVRNGKRNDNWQESLINLDTHDYKIEDGILMKLDKAKKPTPRKHAELACKYFMDDTVQIQFRHSGPIWHNTENPEFIDGVEYREKPKTKTVRFRNYVDAEGMVWASKNDPIEICDAQWIGDWQEVTIND